MTENQKYHAELMRLRATRPKWNCNTPARVAAVITGAAEMYGISTQVLKDNSMRSFVVSSARHQAVHALRAMSYSTTAIGRFLGLHHASVLAHLKSRPIRRDGKSLMVSRPVTVSDDLLGQIIEDLKQANPSEELQGRIAELECRRRISRAVRVAREHRVKRERIRMDRKRA